MIPNPADLNTAAPASAPSPELLAARGAARARGAAARAGQAARDRQLVAKELAGDRDAFGALVARHEKRVFQLARALLKSPADAADIAQETFVRAYVNLKSYRSDGSFTAWVAKIANNLAIDYLRRQKLQSPTEFDESLLERDSAGLAGSLLSGALRSDPQADTLRRELGEQLEAALGQLPEKHRAILLLREVDGLSYEELAAALDIPVGTVMSRLYHARMKMQAILATYAGGSPEGAAEGKPGEER